MNGYVDIFLRSIVLFITLLIFARIMGRKQLSEVTYFDYIVGITIGSIAAAISVDKRIDFFQGISAAVVWTIMPIIIGIINLKSLTFRRITDGDTLIVIENGVVNDKNMKKAKYNIEDLLMQLREKGVFDLAEVEFALLEPSGQLSVLKKAEFNPVTPKDMNIKTNYKGMLIELIVNGEVIDSNLRSIKKDRKWLEKELKIKNVSRVEEVIYAAFNSNNELEVVIMDNLKKNK